MLIHCYQIIYLLYSLQAKKHNNGIKPSRKPHNHTSAESGESHERTSRASTTVSSQSPVPTDVPTTPVPVSAKNNLKHWIK